MRSSVLFWNWWISWRATIPGQYFQGLFNSPTIKNSFLRALPPMIGQSFFWAISSPADVNGPASAAIWANCPVGDNSWDLPTSSNFLTSSILLPTSPRVGGFHGCMYLCSCLYLHCWWPLQCCGSLLICLFFWLCHLNLSLCPGFYLPVLCLPSFGGHLSACLAGTTKSTNQKLRQLYRGHVVFVNWLLHIFKVLAWIFTFSCLFHHVWWAA